MSYVSQSLSIDIYRPSNFLFIFSIHLLSFPVRVLFLIIYDGPGTVLYCPEKNTLSLFCDNMVPGIYRDLIMNGVVVSCTNDVVSAASEYL